MSIDHVNHPQVSNSGTKVIGGPNSVKYIVKHIYLSGMWFNVDLKKTNTQKGHMRTPKYMTTLSKLVNY